VGAWIVRAISEGRVWRRDTRLRTIIKLLIGAKK
jgi:hypothetical protein